MSQLVGSLGGASFAVIAGLAIYGFLAKTVGIRLTPDEERRGADISIHKIGANPESDIPAR